MTFDWTRFVCENCCLRLNGYLPLQTPGSCPVMGFPCLGEMKQTNPSSQRPNRPNCPPQVSFSTRAHWKQQPHASSAREPWHTPGSGHSSNLHGPQLNARNEWKKLASSTKISIHGHWCPLNPFVGWHLTVPVPFMLAFRTSSHTLKCFLSNWILFHSFERFPTLPCVLSKNRLKLRLRCDCSRLNPVFSVAEKTEWIAAQVLQCTMMQPSRQCGATCCCEPLLSAVLLSYHHVTAGLLAGHRGRLAHDNVYCSAPKKPVRTSTSRLLHTLQPFPWSESHYTHIRWHYSEFFLISVKVGLWRRRILKSLWWSVVCSSLFCWLGSFTPGRSLS